MSVEPSQELLAAIGSVAVEAARLEYWIASLVMHLDGLTNDEARTLLGRSGAARRRLEQLVAAGAQPRGKLLGITMDIATVLNDRGALLHAVAMEEHPEDAEPRLVFWHPKTDQDLQDVTVENLDGHADAISRVAGRIARLTHEIAPDEESADDRPR